MLFGSKKKQEQTAQEREAEQAWALYGKEVDAYLEDARLNRAFKDLETSKAVTRPPLAVKVAREEDTPLPLDLALRVKRGEIQASKAYRFVLDPELKAFLSTEPPRPQPPALSADLQRRVGRGEIQASKAYRFMTDPDLRALLPRP